MITSCILQAKDGNAEKQFTILRNRIHTMEFYGFLKLPTAGALIKQSKILDDGKGLPLIFSGHDSSIFPYDIRADAEMLWRRWVVKDLSPDLLRGINTVKGVLASSNIKRTNHSSQKNYEYKRPANVFGANGLVNGQWWPSRLCAMRDGAHGAIEAGIWGQTNIGAFAVCVSEGHYQDKDAGKVILYCGTQGENRGKSIGTKQLDETMRSGEPLRVLRAAKKDSKYAPEKGIRYDGLYEVKDSEILDSENVMVRFTLKRLEGQDPIRYRGDAARPTQQEKREWMNIRNLVS
ncbi:PUA-like domain-containing protein [Amylocarpus encephaloides]|uniref:PUA-like domain-containing protein n=1 Tax=Amylocarpus encephaloides TaxID=45428 RepID=A0A9P7YEJ5_9HELO|nr:PUA-like domain-containing protein [Amylocarpus encephaloides]